MFFNAYQILNIFIEYIHLYLDKWHMNIYIGHYITIGRQVARYECKILGE
jgi:hypothetical protein